MSEIPVPAPPRLSDLPQCARGLQAGTLLVWRYRLDRCRVEDFRWMPYGSDDLRFLSPDWIRSGPEIRAWWSVVPIVCFNLVHMHHVDRVMRQLGADQSIPVDLVNVDAFLTTTGKGEDVWWPTHRTNRAWYESWMRHATDPVVIQIFPKPDFRGNQEYLDWWDRACRSRFLSDDGLLDNPRVQALPPDIRSTPSQPPPDIPLPLNAPAHRRRRGGRARDTGGPVR
ncbi:hypothetical protein PIB30_088676 [Stylosanthes scabra]|uniref:Aminotransferase-like plant mobile domain-containing protein n=1 Tax=Stylosanthes scabra TaxID=79078 RepID=A0ABU6XT50_9FABA|nr:hypothetical protein [Stylosanthes scabra]